MVTFLFEWGHWRGQIFGQFDGNSFWHGFHCWCHPGWLCQWHHNALGRYADEDGRLYVVIPATFWANVFETAKHVLRENLRCFWVDFRFFVKCVSGCGISLNITSFPDGFHLVSICPTRGVQWWVASCSFRWFPWQWCVSPRILMSHAYMPGSWERPKSSIILRFLVVNDRDTI